MSKKLRILICLLSAIVMTGLLFGCGNNNGEPELPDPIFFTNPIHHADRPDPSIVRHDGAFYMFVTNGWILRSYNLIDWVDAGPYNGRFLPSPPSWHTPRASWGNFWAPHVIRLGGQYVMYYSSSLWNDPNPGIGIATAPHPLGPWTDRGGLFTSNQIGVPNSIDAAVFVAQCAAYYGRVFMIWGSFRGLYAIELTADGLYFADASVAAANQNKTLVAGFSGQAWDAETYEAPYIIFYNGYYYMFVSIGYCCHDLSSTYHVRVVRSRSPLGPFVDPTGRPIVNNRNTGYMVIAGTGDRFTPGSLIGPGHNTVVVDDIGQHWIIYHVHYAVERPDGEIRSAGRFVAIDRLNWRDGWPSVTAEIPSSTRQRGPVIIPR